MAEMRMKHASASTEIVMAKDITADDRNIRPDSSKEPAPGPKRQTRGRVLAIAWAASAIAATCGWLYLLERAVVYSMNLL
jgi:hypothetical protein